MPHKSNRKTSLLTDAHSLIQWLLEFRAEDRPNLEQILKHPWLKAAGKSSNCPSNNKTTVSSSPQTKHLITPSSTVSPSAAKQSQTAISQKEATSSPSHRAGGSRGAGTPSSPRGSSSSYFTPPHGRTGVKYAVVPPSGSSPSDGRGSCTPTPSSLHHKNRPAGGLPPVVSARNVSPSLSARGVSLHRHSPTALKSSKAVQYRFVSPAAPRPTSHCGVGGEVGGLTGNRGGGGPQSEASRTQLLVGRKQAFQ